MQEIYGIAAFRSRQQVLMFENVLRREGVQTQVVSTPRDVSMGCGLSVRFRLEDTDRVIRTLGRINRGNLIGVYRVEHAGGGRAKVTAISMR